MLRIGLDIGGTKTELVALDSDGRELLRRRAPTPHGTYEQALAQLVGTVLQAERELGAPARLGVGVPGLVSPEGHVYNAFATPYNEQPLRQDLARQLAREVRIENDANCLALSEAGDGAGRGARLVFGVVLGTGAGAGIVYEGRVLSGANASAGEWGHNPLPWMTPEEFPGPRCSCGRLGCIEQFVSGTALAADHLRSTGTALDARAVATGAAAGNAACEATLRRFEDRLARALAHVINLLDPEVIVLGGGVSGLERLYRSVPQLWAPHVYGSTPRTRLARAVHGDASGVRGAALLWPA
ncbi:MAG: ROK family protein [Betaproteobacteria bacterium]